jgi:uncharacterized protein YkwD
MLFASCGSQLETTTTTVPMSTASATKSDGTLAGTIHAQVNAYRASKGKSQLPRHAGLDKMAREHSEFMLRNRGKFKVDRTSSLSHYGFEERAFKAQRMMSMGDVAENIATCSGKGSSAASVLVNAWKGSSGHDRNMRGMFNATGIGVAVDSDGTVFATQIFGLEDHSHLTMTSRMRQF